MDIGTDSWQAHCGSGCRNSGAMEMGTADCYRPTYTQETLLPPDDSYWPRYADQSAGYGHHDSYQQQDTRQASAQPSWMSTVKGGRIAKAKGRGGGIAAALVREGEVIGAKAAPIGSNSIGRRLMAKMGWSEGTALGRYRDGR